MRRSLCALALAATATAHAAYAQPCTPPKNSNVARMLGWFASPLAFSEIGPLQRLPAGAVAIGVDVTYVPTPPSSLTRTDFCYTGKSENTGLASVLPRPRLTVGLGNGFSLEAMYLPPVTVADATPNIGGAALAWVSPAISSLHGLHATLRAHGTIGLVKGPITCPKSEIQQTDPGGTCWADRPSEDTYRPNVVGGEVGLASAGTPFAWYGGVGFSSVMPRFQVGYRALNGTLDATKVQVDLTRVTAFAGIAYAPWNPVSFSAQLYSVPEDATTGRVGILWRLW